MLVVASLNDSLLLLSFIKLDLLEWIYYMVVWLNI